MLCDKALAQFKELYFLEFGTELTNEEATTKAMKVFTFFKTIVNELSKNKEIINFNQKGGVLNETKSN
jgi:hypothetical protein